MPTAHPAAAIFPLIEGKDFDELVADVKANGLRDPIVTWRETILDGRNRLRACEAADVAPRYREHDGDDPVAFVISANLHRRHLNAVQRAAIAAKLANLKQGRPENTPPVGVSMTGASKLLDVARSSVEHARAIYTHGTADQVTAMERGTLPLRPTAEKLRKNVLGNARKGKRGDRTAKYVPETQRQRERAQGQKDRMVTSLSIIKGNCRGLAEFDIGMAIAACSPAEMKTWSQIARDNARTLTAFAAHLEKELEHGKAQTS